MESHKQSLSAPLERADDEAPNQRRVRPISENHDERDQSHCSGDASLRQNNQRTQPSGVSQISGYLPFAGVRRYVLGAPTSSRLFSSTEGKEKQTENMDTLVGTQEHGKRDDNSDELGKSRHRIAELEKKSKNNLQIYKENLQVYKDQLQYKEREWTAIEQKLRSQIHQAKQEATHRSKIMETQINKLQLEKSALEVQHATFIRKQQEASFKQMESARWLPVDETKIMSDLDNLKKSMRSWAKKSSINDITLLRTFEKNAHLNLMRQLSDVVVLENGYLPASITNTTKSPMLLLNALLAHHLYMTLFRSPFFFLGDELEDGSYITQSAGILDHIYYCVKAANQKDANLWRSQTLRLLKPPLFDDTSDSEKELHHSIEQMIAKVAQQQAAAFLSGSASLLVENATNSDVTNKLEKIYIEAAQQSFMLWTRRTEMICSTLRDVERLGFDADSQYFDPDTLMRHEDHEDGLKGRPVTLMVHPILQVAGTDEAKDYDQRRVWVKGVVWLDSKTT